MYKINPESHASIEYLGKGMSFTLVTWVCGQWLFTDLWIESHRRCTRGVPGDFCILFASA